MDLTLALQRAVRGYALGTEALAAAMRLSATTLNHKVSPTYGGSHVSPEEAADICELTGDVGFLHALAARLGHVALAVPQSAGAATPGAVALAQSVQQFGDFASAAAGSLADGRVTGNELADMEREAAEAMAAINQLVAIARSLREAGLPAGRP